MRATVPTLLHLGNDGGLPSSSTGPTMGSPMAESREPAATGDRGGFLAVAKALLEDGAQGAVLIGQDIPRLEVEGGEESGRIS
jgi:hypothetical protein